MPLVLAVAELCVPPAIHAAPLKEVLVLYASRRDTQVAIVGERELPRLLEDGLPEGLDYYSEYIDQGRFPDIEYQAALGEFLRKKYAHTHFDVIITMHDLATDFVRRNRDELFPGVPVVFYAGASAGARDPNSTGVVSPMNFGGSIDLALALQPDTRHVFVVIGAGSGDKSYETLARLQFKRFEPRLTITYLTGLPIGALEARLSALPPQSIVYYMVVDRDGTGRIVHPLAYLDRVAAVSNAPTYCWVDSAMDHGIVGGSLKSHSLQMRALAGLALRVLKGEPADRIPVASPDLNVRQVDWRQLQRWTIPEERVASDVLVRFRQPSAWDRYGGYILGVLAVLLIQSALIAGLVVQRVRRQRAEAEVRTHAAELEVSYGRIRDLGARLLHAHEEERARIARELHDDISQQMALLEIDLQLMTDAAQVRGGPAAMPALHRAREIARSVHDLSHRLHPAKLQLIGLAAALDGLQQEFSRPGLSIAVDRVAALPTLSQDLRLCLFRVTQEGLRNAVRHSGARHVSVTLQGDALGLALTIADDGRGFDVAGAWGTGLGLVSMAERLGAIGAALSVRSAPGEGTRVEVSVPAEVLQRTASMVPAEA